jgi:hypothetical protein
MSTTMHSPPDQAASILSYLRDRLPGYPYDDCADPDFVDELLEDFPHTDVLEQIKAFRWFHDNDPAARVSNFRVAIRRWVANGYHQHRF